MPKPKKKRRLTSSFELQLLRKGYSRIVGIDEVGRGAWAGPVVVSGFVFGTSSKIRRGVDDSKRLTRVKREKLQCLLSDDEHLTLAGGLECINTSGVGKTVERKIFEIIENFQSPETFFLIDGRFATNFGENTMQIIGGDMLHYSIASASILAKVYRDKLMRDLHKDYRHYGFNSNVGYPTPHHLKALDTHGASELHRKSFKPISEMLSQLKIGINE